jgi:hypothetical protein
VGCGLEGEEKRERMGERVGKESEGVGRKEEAGGDYVEEGAACETIQRAQKFPN